VSSLNLVDLAGSECAAKSGADGQRRTEGSYINRSLLTLATVIQRLITASGHVPYRDSKLTRILEPALGGNSRTAIICTVTPAAQHFAESLNTLKFAARAKRMKNRPIVNDVNVSAQLPTEDLPLLKRYRDEIENLRREKERLEQVNLQDRVELEDKRGQVEELKMQIQRLEHMFVDQKSSQSKEAAAATAGGVGSGGRSARFQLHGKRSSLREESGPPGTGGDARATPSTGAEDSRKLFSQSKALVTDLLARVTRRAEELSGQVDDFGALTSRDQTGRSVRSPHLLPAATASRSSSAPAGDALAHADGVHQDRNDKGSGESPASVAASSEALLVAGAGRPSSDKGPGPSSPQPKSPSAGSSRASLRSIESQRVEEALRGELLSELFSCVEGLRDVEASMDLLGKSLRKRDLNERGFKNIIRDMISKMGFLETRNAELIQELQTRAKESQSLRGDVKLLEDNILELATLGDDLRRKDEELAADRRERHRVEAESAQRAAEIEALRVEVDLLRLDREDLQKRVTNLTKGGGAAEEMQQEMENLRQDVSRLRLEASTQRLQMQKMQAEMRKSQVSGPIGGGGSIS